MFQLTYKAHFDAAHYLKGYHGKGSQVHGHGWEVEVCYEAEHLNKNGMVADFADIKTLLDAELPDHRLLNDWMSVTPTVGNLAYVIYGICFAFRGDYPNATLKSVTVWESPNASVRYSPTEA